MKWYLIPWKKYTILNGRASRKEFWTFVLINWAISLSLSAIPVVNNINGNPFPILALIFSSATFIPSISVAVRRLHDTNRSGLNLFWCLLPLAGSIVLLIFYLQDSDKDENKYGTNPKELQTVEDTKYAESR